MSIPDVLFLQRNTLSFPYLTLEIYKSKTHFDKSSADFGTASHMLYDLHLSDVSLKAHLFHEAYPT